MDLDDRPSPDQPPKRSRVEDEIREILHKADRPPTVVEQMRSRARSGRGTLLAAAAKQRRFDVRGPLAPLLGTLGVAILAVLIQGVSSFLAFLLGLIAFGLFCSLWIAPSTGPGPGNRWRGRDLSDLPGRPPTPFRRPGQPRR